MMSGILKLLYVLAGLSLKETIDSVRAIWRDKVDKLERNVEALKEYKPVPALMVGTLEAHQAIARAQHQSAVAPTITELRKKIRRLKWLPVIAWGLLTIGLFIAVCVIEANEASEG